MITNFLKGIVAYVQALQDVQKFRLGKYFLYTGFVAVGLLLAIGTIAWSLSDNLFIFIKSYFPTSFTESYGYIGEYLITAVLIVFSFIFYKNLLLAALAPLLSALSEKIEYQLYPERKKPSNTIPEMISLMLRGLRLALRSIFWELLLTAFVLILTTILPFLGIISFPAIFLIQSYYLGAGNFDYTLERRYGVSETIQFSKENRWLALGIGVVHLAGISTLIGVFFVPVLAAAASTRKVLKLVP